MRIAHVLRKYVPAEWGGTETALHRLAEGLAREGVESTAYAPALPPDAGAGGPDPLALAGCQVRRFQACLPAWGLPPETRRQLIAVGGNLLSFELPRLLAREPGLAVIHAHTLGRIGGITRRAARRRGLPFVVTIHGGVLDLPPALKRELNAPRRGFDWGRPFGWWWGAHRVLAEADTILTCNEREADLLRRQYPDRRIVVQPHGVDTARFSENQRAAALAAFPFIQDRDVLLCVGRIDAVKNQLWLVQRAPVIFQRHPNAVLVLAGAGTDEPYLARLKAEVVRLGLQQRVFLTGGLPPGDPRLTGLMQQARVVLLPSISETFGLVLLEAWAAGAAVLASRTTGAGALIRPGENGWLFDQGDALSFHALLNRTLQEPALTAQLAAAGARLVAGQYDTVVLARRMVRLYTGLIEEKQHALRDPA